MKEKLVAAPCFMFAVNHVRPHRQRYRSGCRMLNKAAQKLPSMRCFRQVPPHSGSLLLPSAFKRNSMALAAGAFEFIVLTGRTVEAVAGFAQRRPFQAWLSLVVNRQRLVRVRAAGNRRDLHLGNLAHCAADRLPDLAEGL